MKTKYLKLLLLLIPAVLHGQSANFPTSVSTTANIPGATNRARTTLATSITNSSTTIVLTSASAFAVNIPFTIGTEDIICTSLSTNTFSGCTRGYGGSTAAAHLAGVAVTGTVIAYHVNTLRAEVIAVEQQLAARSLNYCADAGSSDAYACSLSPPPSSYATGACYSFKGNTANTGAATINFNSLGAKTIVKATGGVTTALEDNDIRAGQLVSVCYDGTNMQMQSTLGNAPSGGGSGDAAAEVSVASGATPTYAVSSNTVTTFRTTALATNITNCTISGAQSGQVVQFEITASGANRTMACSDIAGLGTLTITSGDTCYISTTATSSSTLVVDGSISCPNGNQAVFTVSGNATVAVPAGIYTMVGETLAQTLESKTIDSADNTLKLDGVTVTGVSGSNGVVCMSNGACGGGGGDPTDISGFILRDNFCHVPAVYEDVRAAIGDLGLWWNSITGGGYTSVSSASHPCYLNGSTNTTPGNVWFLVTSSTGPSVAPSTQTNTTIKFTFSVNTISDSQMGFWFGPNECVSGASNCLGLSYVNGTDSVFKFRSCSGGTCTTQSSTVTPADGTTYTLVMSVTTAGTWSFSINGETPLTITTNLSSSTYSPQIQVQTNTSSVRTLSLYRFLYVKTDEL